MEKIIRYKIDENRTAEVEITLTDDGRFSASGTLYEKQGCKWECDYCGQCLDSLSELIDDPVFTQIYWLWKRYHLNDLHAGTPVQEYALEHAPICSLRKADYKYRCEYLKSIGLYEVGGFKYGHGWLTEKIESHDLELIKRIVKNT